AGSGAAAHNTMTNVVEATAVSGSLLDAGGSVTVGAVETANIKATVVSAAVSVAASGTASVGLAIAITEATNNVGGRTTAKVDGSTVASGGTVQVTAVRGALHPGGGATGDAGHVGPSGAARGRGAVSPHRARAPPPP